VTFTPTFRQLDYQLPDGLSGDRLDLKRLLTPLRANELPCIFEGPVGQGEGERIEEALMSDECWNAVDVYGPATEIARFRKLCIALPPGSAPESVRGGWGGYEVSIGFNGIIPAGPDRRSRQGTVIHAWNYRERAPQPGSWFFAFDTGCYFPEYLFIELASLFPKLHFDCDCIDSMDEYMGFGWFNIPLGGETFRQDLKVPKNYWRSGRGYKRKPSAHAKYEALVEALKQAAQQEDQNP